MVEIRVDTKRDSDEEIRKTIQYLQSVIGEVSTNYAPAASTSTTADFDSTAAPAFTNIFGSDDDAPSDAPVKEETEMSDDEATIEIVEF